MGAGNITQGKIPKLVLSKFYGKFSQDILTMFNLRSQIEILNRFDECGHFDFW